VALEAGCRQQPASGVLLGLNETIFSSNQISIVDPKTLEQIESTKPALETPAIVGIAAGGLVLILAIAGFTFVCVRKRKNRRARAEAEADFYNRFNRHNRSSSFQCQTHMISPRFWPGAGAEEGVSTPVVDSPDVQQHRSSIWKHPHGPEYPSHSDDATAHISKKAAMAAVPLHHITTSVPPPPQAYASPSSAEKVYHSPSDFKSPLSAESARSTSALLPSIKPYVPAEHGVHAQASPHNTFDTPTSATAPFTRAGGGAATTGTGMTPLLKSHGWPLPNEPQQHHRHDEQQKQQQQQQQEGQKNIIKLGNDSVPPPPPPPPLKTSRSSGLLAGRKSPKNGGGTGSPVESWEIQTAFAAPPKR
jgi:hypothetical protein